MANEVILLAPPLQGRGWGGAFRSCSIPASGRTPSDAPTPGPSPEGEGWR
jgi:hypothetical protein